MTVLVLIVVGLALMVPFGIHRMRVQKVRALLSQFDHDSSAVPAIVLRFENLLAGDRFVANFDHQEWFKDASKFEVLTTIDLSVLGAQVPTAYSKLREYLRDGRDLINAHNEAITQREIERLKPLLDNRGLLYNDEQLLAAVSEEDNTLLVAGAGTGKTTTILGKLSYLIDGLHVEPKNILVLSFTRKVVDELKARIDKRFPEPGIDIRTFHSFGLSVLSEVLLTKPDIFDEKDRKNWINTEFETLLAKDHAYLRAAITYFAYYMQAADTEKRFGSLDEYYRFVRSEGVLTFLKERVKSHQEAMIANYLYLHNIRYEYESPYKHQTADKVHKQYRPDFYLPDYDLYLEHFGIDRKGNVYFTDNDAQNQIEGVKYREGIDWKRALHEEMHTELIETYSYQFTEKTWEADLKDKLARHGVELKQRPLSEVIGALQDSGQIREIAVLFSTFLDLAKSNHYSEAALRERIESRERPRDIAFGTIFLPIYRKYEEYLAMSKKIDFHDMLNMASEFIEQGRFIGSYKYILIDEFQDFSVSKDLMVRSLCKQNPSVKLFCVGDDWQSIYRFAGADVSLMTDFAKNHGYTRTLKLQKTNRFDRNLAKLTNEFILRNPTQIRKEIEATKILAEEPLNIIRTSSSAEASKAVAELLGEMNKHTAREPMQVYLLGRYNHNKPDQLRMWQQDFKNLAIEFMTTHSSKGLEADQVIVLDVVSGMYGFPSQVADDPVLKIVLSGEESYPHAEERRLMYVALTRTRNKVFLMTIEREESPFIPELEGALPRKSDTQKGACPKCGGEIVERTSRYGVFFGCKNYPLCTWTRNKEQRSLQRAHQYHSRRSFGRGRFY